MIKMKKQNIIPIIALLALVSLMIAPVCAETLTGTLGGSETTSLNLGTTTNAQSTPSFTALMVKNMEYTAGLNTVIRFDSNPSGTSQIPTFTNATIMSGQTTFIVTCPNAGNVTVATGSIGYQRFFSGWPISTETYGYQWYVFDYWNPTALTGNRALKVWFNATNVNGISLGGTSVGNLTTNPYNGFVSVGLGSNYVPYSAHGWYTNNIASPWFVSYSVTKPAGLGITGNITKTVGGTTYGTQTFVVNGSSNLPIASEGTINGNPYYFNAPLDTVKLAFYSFNGWSNTSVLFAPTPTPTITPTPTPTNTIPAGYVRSTFVTIDGVNYNTIHGPNIMLYDVENGSWSNSTSDADGIFYIDTLPYHTINAYATYTIFANHYADASIIGAVTGNSGMDYPIYMFPPGLPPGPGNINLYIPVVDASTSYAIGSVGVQVELPTGAITGDITGPGGDAAVFVVPNNTIIKARASKTGYGPVTESFNSGEVSPKTKTLSMYRLVVTPVPTATIGPGGTTPVYVDPRTTIQKDADMMNQIRDAGPGLIGLAIVATIFGLIRLMTKK